MRDVRCTTGFSCVRVPPPGRCPTTAAREVKASLRGWGKPVAAPEGAFPLKRRRYDTNLVQWPFPGGATIEPGQFKIIWADGEPGQNTTNRADLHVSFSLRAAGEAIGLFAADGTQIDRMAVERQRTAELLRRLQPLQRALQVLQLRLGRFRFRRRGAHAAVLLPTGMSWCSLRSRNSHSPLTRRSRSS